MKNKIRPTDILIVEDNRTNQMLLSIILENLDQVYEIVDDGVQAVVETNGFESFQEAEDYLLEYYLQPTNL